MSTLARLRRWWRRRHETRIEVTGGVLTYPGPLDEATVAQIRAAFEAAVRSGRPPEVLP
jgi:hypothetical protein